MNSTASASRAGKKSRPCPVLNGPISAADCGRQRGSRLACPATCPFFPFAPAGYDLWLKVEAEWLRKSLDRVIRARGRDRLQAQMKREQLPLDSESATVEAALARALHRLLFLEPGPDGRTVAAAWEAADWEGLNNDEQLMMRHRRGTRLAVLEVHRVRSEREVECVDLLEPARPPFRVVDRHLAPRVVRFTRLLTGLTDYPHFAAPTLPTLEVPLAVWADWWTWARERAAAGSGAEPSSAAPNVRTFLETHLREAVEHLNELLRAYRVGLLEQMGLLQYLARYRLEGSAADFAAALREHPALRAADLPALPQLGPPLAGFEWVDNTADQAPAPADRLPSGSDPRVVGAFRLYPGFLVVETASHPRHLRAREFVEREWAGRVHFQDEAQIDLSRALQSLRQRAALVAAAEDAIFGAPEEPETVAAPAEARAGAPAPSAAEPEPDPEQIRAEHDARYRQLLDRALPELDGLTPRQAAADPAHRARVIELFKAHLHNLERRNRREPVPLSLDWVLDELGLGELK